LNKIGLIALCILGVALCHAQSAVPSPLQFDLSKLGMVINGEQICNDSGNRLQDFPSSVMDQIVAAGPKAVPVLIRMIADRRMANTREPLICYWPGMAIGDIAFCLLTNLFTEPDGKTTVPGADWNDLLGPGNTGASWEQLHGFIRKHGSAALQARWRAVWDKYRGQVAWDPKERCFKLKAS
jgi:hypothetical protein